MPNTMDFKDEINFMSLKVGKCITKTEYSLAILFLRPVYIHFQEPDSPLRVLAAN